ncbi:thioredoxin-like protein [Chytriomyces sp. MP71]|nr:thioredoxin-like protein [Chytriomyces sp. MP71]
MTRVIPVTIITDTICPWCYIGKKRFEKAVASFSQSHPDVQFALSYEPFQLNPSLPKQGMNKLESYKAKFGEARTQQMIPYMQKVGAAEGIQFSYGGLIGNSLDSHRLVRFASETGKQNEVINALYRAYFEEEKNIGDNDVLVKVATDAGLDGAKTRAVLEGDYLLDETKKAVVAVHARGINGVPHFIIDNKFEISGGQDPATFEAIFSRAVGDVKTAANI